MYMFGAVTMDKLGTLPLERGSTHGFGELLLEADY